ncbi:MAG: hypothetical protein JST04_07435 [Bdellovibrionales bacterium]|nr:hypothetical protein [Bdellovibrionales bacterium]
MTDDPNEKKTGDLTALSDLPLGEEVPGSAPTMDLPAPPALEGLDDLLSPMSPTSTGLGAGEPNSSSFTFSPDPNAPPPEMLTGLGDDAFNDPLKDPIANLPPVDADTLAAASGTDELPSLSPEGFEAPADFSADAPMQPSSAAILDDPSIESASTPSRVEGTAVGQAIAGALSAISATATTNAPTTMESVRAYSDHVAPSATPSVAETPYSLAIEGAIRQHEREALVNILTRENLGIREVELEPQFAAGHILIPRISEYAGVMIVQALRNTTAKIRLGPSERIFVSREAADSNDTLVMPPSPESEVFITEESEETADDTIVLTSADSIPGRKLLAAIDTLHNSMNLKAFSLSQPQSPIFQDAIERLKKQLKYQAHHRGANALVGFKYTLHPLEGQTMYKLVVEARAVKVGQA